MQAHFHEPWSALPRRIESLDPFPDGCPEGADPDRVAEQRERAAKVAAKAEYTVWGSSLCEPGTAKGLISGRVAPFDDHGVLFVVRDPPYDGGVSAKDLAERVCRCVNACAGIRDPHLVIPAVKDLLRDLLTGDCDPADSRVVALLARMLPPEEEEPDGL